MHSRDRADGAQRPLAIRIYLIVAILALLLSIYASGSLFFKPVGSLWVLDIAEVVLGSVMFFYLTWVVLSQPRRGAERSQARIYRHAVSPFFACAVVVGLAAGGSVAYWQGRILRGTDQAAVGLAILVIDLAGAVAMVLLSLLRCQQRSSY